MSKPIQIMTNTVTTGGEEWDNHPAVERWVVVLCDDGRIWEQWSSPTDAMEGDWREVKGPWCEK